MTMHHFFVHRRFYEHFFFERHTKYNRFPGSGLLSILLTNEKKTTLVLIKLNRLEGFVWKSLDVRITNCAVAMVTDNIWWYHSYQQLLSLFPIFWILLIFLPTAFAIWLLATDMDGEMLTFWIGVFFNFMEYNRCCETNQMRWIIRNGFFWSESGNIEKSTFFACALRSTKFHHSAIFFCNLFFFNFFYFGSGNFQFGIIYCKCKICIEIHRSWTCICRCKPLPFKHSCFYSIKFLLWTKNLWITAKI